MRCIHQNVKISLLANTTFYGRQRTTLRSNLHIYRFYILRRDVIWWNLNLTLRLPFKVCQTLNLFALKSSAPFLVRQRHFARSCTTVPRTKSNENECSFFPELYLPFRSRRKLQIFNFWASSWDYGTYHIGDQRRLRRACASAHSRLSLRCSHTWTMEVDEGSDQKIWHLAPLDGSTCAFKEWFGERKVPQSHELAHFIYIHLDGIPVRSSCAAQARCLL